MKHANEGRAMSARSVVQLIDRYTTEHGPAPLIAELSRTRRQSATASFFAGFLCGALIIVTAYAVGAVA